MLESFKDKGFDVTEFYVEDAITPAAQAINEKFEKLTGNTFNNWKNYCGVYFRFPTDRTLSVPQRYRPSAVSFRSLPCGSFSPCCYASVQILLFVSLYKIFRPATTVTSADKRDKKGTGPRFYSADRQLCSVFHFQAASACSVSKLSIT